MKSDVMRLVLEQMSSGYREQILLYQNMYELALRQKKCLEAPEVEAEELLALIGQRENLIHCLEERQEKMLGLKEEVVSALGLADFTLSGVAARFADPVVTELVECLGDLTELLAQIKELDKKNEDTLRERIQETAEKLKQLQQGKRARKAYQSQSTDKDGIFVDFSK